MCLCQVGFSARKDKKKSDQELRKRQTKFKAFLWVMWAKRTLSDVMMVKRLRTNSGKNSIANWLTTRLAESHKNGQTKYKQKIQENQFFCIFYLSTKKS